MSVSYQDLMDELSVLKRDLNKNYEHDSYALGWIMSLIAQLPGDLHLTKKQQVQLLETIKRNQVGARSYTQLT